MQNTTDLIKLSNLNFFSQQLNNDYTSNKAYNDKVIISSFNFSVTPKVFFVNSFENNKSIINRYLDLEKVKLTKKEKDVVSKTLPSLNQNPNFYDGDQILISDVHYEKQSNNIYLKAKRCKFSVLNALVKNLFPETSDLIKKSFYRVGVLAPFITNDNYSFFFKRNADQRYSCSGGLLEPTGKGKLLANIILHQAKNESLDEFLGDRNGNSRVTFSDPLIKSLFIRQSGMGIKSIEFLVPMHLNCNKRSLEQILNNNISKDKWEHSNSFYSVSLEASKRNQVIRFLNKKLKGNFLYQPILASLTKAADEKLFGEIIYETNPHLKVFVYSK